MVSSTTTTRGLPWLLAAAMTLGGCTTDDDGLLLLAASSTADAMRDVAEAFEAATGTPVRLSTAASNTLAFQILAGADADLFLSASPGWIDAVAAEGRVKERTPLLGNALVLVVPRGAQSPPRSPSALSAEAITHVALAGERVPAGQYAEAALAHAGVLESLRAGGRLARGEDARLTLAYVEAGEAEAGVVYATDARASAAVDVVYTFPPESHPPILYPLARLSDDARARAFFTFAKSAEARALMARHGFVPLGAPVP
jgi:molybdate transport system substrate-binding protein